MKPLPKLKEKLSNEQVIQLLEEQEWWDILMYLDTHGFPEEPFSCDG